MNLKHAINERAIEQLDYLKREEKQNWIIKQILKLMEEGGSKIIIKRTIVTIKKTMKRNPKI